MIKRKWLDRKEIENILEKDLIINYRKDEIFEGYVSFLELKKVKEEIKVNLCGKNRTVLKDGHCWLQWLPKDKNYAVIAIYDENKKLIEWYIDIILGQGVEKGNMPYYDDLFLDVVVFTDGNMLFLDEDELLEALKANEITKEQYKLAYEEGNKILNEFKENFQDKINYTNEMLEYINEKK